MNNVVRFPLTPPLSSRIIEGFVGSTRNACEMRPVSCGHGFEWLKAHCSQMLGRLRLRRAIRRELLSQPDSVLEDFGASRELATREANKPFWRA